MLRSLPAVLPLLGLSLLAHAGITVTNVARSVHAQACGTTNAGTFCDYDADQNYTTGFWTRNALADRVASSPFGSVHSTAQAVQHSTATDSTIECQLTMYNFISASGDTFGGSEAKIAFEVRFYTPASADMHLTTDIVGDGWWIVVNKFSGSEVFSGRAATSTIIPIDRGEWVMRIENGRGPNCGPCSLSITETLSATVTFDFGPCLADFNADLLVDDADFSIFAVAYDELICPSFPEPCTGDINKDGYVDDADFQLFVVAYNDLLCP